jgi:hypothetical protein
MILFNYFTNLKKWQFIIIRIKKFKEDKKKKKINLKFFLIIRNLFIYFLSFNLKQ